MKPYKISLIRLCLVLLGYLIYNLVYFALFYSAGYAFFILWPIFFLAIGLILLGNFFAFRDPLKLKSSFKDNQLVQKTSTIQVILATIGVCLQLSNMVYLRWWPINYIDNFPTLFCISLLYSAIFFIGNFQKTKLDQDDKSSNKSSLVFGAIVVFLCNLLLITNSKVSVWGSTDQYVQDFKDFGLKGKVEVYEKKHLIEPYNGTLTTLFYNETLSNGESFIDFIYVSDVQNGTHVTTLDEKDKEEIRSYLENDTEKELFDKVTLEQFEFVLKVYEERIYNLKLEDDIATKINEAVGGKLLENYNVEIKPADKIKFYSDLIKEAVKNRENGDTDVAGFYNIDINKHINDKTLIVSIEHFNFIEIEDKQNHKIDNRVDYLKDKLTSLPVGTLSDGIYKFTVSTLSDGNVKITMVVENGKSYFEKDTD
ncbi:hypothetical protein GOM46_05555 [Streptococcus infantis]|jgi:hypothetical protein|uniref:Uncharacterized protein n=2 Tax=Streptococcus TaxID=1301 RepID=F5W260_9STRE|nr:MULTISPECIES: hypothetical protein [Streptococcus]EFX40485.1 hypothetical protein HMPREF9180_1038 [Streptococcus peroris ATCC 700780]EGL84531.1 hypothetical protein HMPREF9967_0819 [Streptococcus infantis SK1076]MCP9057135.1 hypothetical protein [Streptococcus infantis]MCP9081431.1 hypothetical protein [Streptococcus infantis]UJD04066.1 hypothetical protein GOM46_05555 [Streptococcus infantis]